MPVYAPAHLEAVVKKRAGALELRAFLTRQENQRLREMWCAGRFSAGYERNMEPCEVDIEKRDEQAAHDFKLITEKDVLPFQVVEVLEAGRRRGDEYKNIDSEPLYQEWPVYNAAYAEQRVNEELQRKVARRYAGAAQLHILAYLNVNAAAVAWAPLALATQEAARTFASVWCVTDHMLACLHSGGRWHGLVGWMQIDNEG